MKIKPDNPVLPMVKELRETTDIAELEQEKTAFENGRTSLNALRKKHGLPTIKNGLMDKNLIKLD